MDHTPNNKKRPVLIAHAGEQLRIHYLLHHSSSVFWDAYQAIQIELAENFPDQRVQLCNLMAEIAQELGAVDKAHLVDEVEA